jgi:flagellar basal body rod protein FlgG
MMMLIPRHVPFIPASSGKLVSPHQVGQSHRVPWQWMGHASGDGLGITVQAMMTHMNLMETHTNNIAYYGTPGYQAKEARVYAAKNQTFTEFLHASHSTQQRTNTEVGRIRYTSYVYDLALEEKGYFQKYNPQTGQMDLTRDGRIRLDAEGRLIGNDGGYFLNREGTTIMLPHLLQDPKWQLQIDKQGVITLTHPYKNEVIKAGVLKTVREDGRTDGPPPPVLQGFVEDSNVMLQNEYIGIVPQKRYFEANRQMFLTNNDLMTKMVQELGRAQ